MRFALIVSRAMIRDPIAAWIGHVEHLPRDLLAQPLDECPAARVGAVAVDDDRERVHGVAGEHDVHAHERRPAGSRSRRSRSSRSPSSATSAGRSSRRRPRRAAGRTGAARAPRSGTPCGRSAPRRSLFSSMTAPTCSLGTIVLARMYGSSTSSTSRGKSARVVHLDLLAGLRQDAVRDVGRGHEQVEVELALEPLADDLHVEEAEEPAAEAEPERLRRLRLVEERGVVQLQLVERVAKLRVLVRLGRDRGRRRRSASRPCSREAARPPGRVACVSVSPTRSRLTSLRPVIT